MSQNEESPADQNLFIFAASNGDFEGGLKRFAEEECWFSDNNELTAIHTAVF